MFDADGPLLLLNGHLLRAREQDPHDVQAEAPLLLTDFLVHLLPHLAVEYVVEQDHEPDRGVLSQTLTRLHVEHQLDQILACETTVELQP